MKYIINWIICEKHFPNVHDIHLQGCQKTRTIYFQNDMNQNIHVSNLENFKIFIEKHSKNNWNMFFCYKYWKHFLKKLQLFNSNISLILEKFLMNEFKQMKKSFHEWKQLSLFHPNLENILPWFRGFYRLESNISNETIINYTKSLEPLFTQFVNPNDQKQIAFLLHDVMNENFCKLEAAIHSEMDINEIILGMKQQTNHKIDQHFKFIQTKQVDFRLLFLNLFDIHLHIVEIENNTFTLMLQLQVIFSLVFPENVSTLKNEIVCSPEMRVTEMNYDKMVTVHPMLRGSFIDNYCTAEIVKVDCT